MCGADVYLLRSVLHDWSDEFAIKILKKLVPALEKGKGKVLINDICLPEWASIELAEQRFLRDMSLAMKAIQNGRERDYHDWQRLVSSADPRLTLSVKRPEGSALSIIVVKLGQED